jgi:hypothetical protein
MRGARTADPFNSVVQFEKLDRSQALLNPLLGETELFENAKDGSDLGNDLVLSFILGQRRFVFGAGESESDDTALLRRRRG